MVYNEVDSIKKPKAKQNSIPNKNLSKYEVVSALVPHEKSVGFYGVCDEQSLSFDIENLFGVRTSDCPWEGNN